MDIKELREQAGLSQRELADEIGVSHGLVAQWETGRKEVAPALASAVIKACSPPPDRPTTEPSWQPTKAGIDKARRHLGRRLKLKREEHNLSDEDAAMIALVPLAQYRKDEKGTAIIRYPALHALAQHYGCKMSDLMPKRTYPSAPQDPALRNLHFAQRNASISRGDVLFSRTGTEGAVKKGKD